MRISCDSYVNTAQNSAFVGKLICGTLMSYRMLSRNDGAKYANFLIFFYFGNIFTRKGGELDVIRVQEDMVTVDNDNNR